MKPRRILSVCGIAGPIIFAVIVLTLGFLTPGYSHVRDFMSELGAVDAPYGFVMSFAGLVLLGILVIAFSVGLHRGIKEGSVIGPALLVMSGFSLAATGVFRCDPGCIDISLIGRLHSAFAMLAGFAFIAAMFFIALRLRDDRDWRSYWAYSVATGALTFVFSLLLMSAGDWAGLMQRISMGLPLLWMEVMAIRLFRLKRGVK